MDAHKELHLTLWCQSGCKMSLVVASWCTDCAALQVSERMHVFQDPSDKVTNAAPVTNNCPVTLYANEGCQRLYGQL